MIHTLFFISLCSIPSLQRAGVRELIGLLGRRENVAIANALQLVAARAMPALCRFNYDAVPSSMSPNLSIAIIAFLLLIRYFTM